MPALADRTNKTTVVPSRYAAAGQKSGMPSIRSQLEQAASARDEATKRCAEAIEAKAALESREQATRAAGRCATQIMSLELRQMEQATRASAEDHTQTVKQLETATAGLEQARAHEQASESALEKERETNCGLVRRVEDLEAQLASCHAGLTQLRDSALPAAASQAAAAEARLHRTEERLRSKEARLAEREASLRESHAHFETLHQVLLGAEPRGLAPLAQEALGSFGVLHAELALHTDARFCAVQDALVQLSILTGRLGGEWLPAFLAARQAELHQLDLAPAAEAEAEHAEQGALSPELTRR
tara:strand:- start:361 stop:1269 length:909 start_codon:yes stop_codon:yes gene_type:complete